MIRELVAAVAVAVPFALGAASAPTGADRDPVFRFQDPEILESSGLVVTGDAVVTVNDSGDSARVFVVDPGTGRTRATIAYDGAARDVEALAPAGDDAVWVADIGDNLGARDDITVTRVPLGSSDATVTGERYRLAYPRGEAFDAEALVAHPATGRLYVVTKGVLGGRVYAAPKRLRADAVNRLRPVGEAPGLVTDGAFLPDGKHVIVRNYGRAMLLAFPSWEQVADLDLPRQQQGEGIAVDPDGVVFASSEGAKSELLRITLPNDVRDLVAGEPDSGAALENEEDDAGPADQDATQGDELAPGESGEVQDPADPEVWPWVVGGIAGVLMLIVLLRSLRPR